jgi:GTPase SAR1 family protein
MLLCAIHDRSSFDSLGDWVSTLRGFVRDVAPIAVVGNHIDLEETVQQDEVQESARPPECAVARGPLPDGRLPLSGGRCKTLMAGGD